MGGRSDRRFTRRLAPAGMPAPFIALFWADVALLAVLAGLAASQAGPIAVAPFCTNLLAVIVTWVALPWPGADGRRRWLPLLFLLLCLALGVTGAQGEQSPLVLLALTALATVWGVRASAVVMLLVAGAMAAAELLVFRVDPWVSLVGRCCS